MIFKIAIVVAILTSFMGYYLKNKYLEGKSGYMGDDNSYRRIYMRFQMLVMIPFCISLMLYLVLCMANDMNSRYLYEFRNPVKILVWDDSYNDVWGYRYEFVAYYENGHRIKGVITHSIDSEFSPGKTDLYLIDGKLVFRYFNKTDLDKKLYDRVYNMFSDNTVSQIIIVDEL
jgi:uncharacterized protein YxeA